MRGKYDQTDPNDILRYAKTLIGKNLGDVVVPGFTAKGGKGNLGLYVEKYFFGLEPSNESVPDFVEAGETGLELKTFPIKELKRGGYAAKERVSLGMINYEILASEEWTSSSFRKKNSLLLFLAYLYEQGLSDLEYVFLLAELWDFDEEDLKIIKDDWLKIRDKVREGRAHELSEGDTLYLGAVTKSQKGTDRVRQPFGKEMAKPRALCLKQNYMNVVLGKLTKSKTLDVERVVKSLKEYRKGEGFEEHVIRKFSPFFGKSLDELGEEFDVEPGAKNFAAILTRRILGVNKTKIEEFEKAGIIVKTIRLDERRKPEEAMSFPAMKFKEVANEIWEESRLRDMWSKKFFFVVYRKNGEDYSLDKVSFWSMPESVLDGEVKNIWEKTRACIIQANLLALPKSSESTVVHVRPHGKNAEDVDFLPNGDPASKRCFWLNRDYLARIISPS